MQTEIHQGILIGQNAHIFQIRARDPPHWPNRVKHKLYRGQIEFYWPDSRRVGEDPVYLILDELRASRPVEKVLVKTPAEPRSTELELEMRKKRKKRMRKLEKSQEKKEKKTNRLIETTPGRRIYQLPNRIRPVSLFVRIGAVNTDEDYIQQEYYDLISSDSGAESISPHPAAVEMRDLFHLIEERSPKVANLDEYADELGNKVPKMRPRPQSVQFPLVSAMKKTSNGVASTSEVKRKSLRFLDPKDMKLYEAISHARTPEEGRLETEKRTQGDDNDPLLSNIESLNLDQQ